MGQRRFTHIMEYNYQLLLNPLIEVIVTTTGFTVCRRHLVAVGKAP